MNTHPLTGAPLQQPVIPPLRTHAVFHPEEECTQHSGSYSGRVPGTGDYRCGLCGTAWDEDGRVLGAPGRWAVMDELDIEFALLAVHEQLRADKPAPDTFRRQARRLRDAGLAVLDQAGVWRLTDAGRAVLRDIPPEHREIFDGTRHLEFG